MVLHFGILGRRGRSRSENVEPGFSGGHGTMGDVYWTLSSDRINEAIEREHTVGLTKWWLLDTQQVAP